MNSVIKGNSLPTFTNYVWFVVIWFLHIHCFEQWFQLPVILLHFGLHVILLLVEPSLSMCKQWVSFVYHHIDFQKCCWSIVCKKISMHNLACIRVKIIFILLRYAYFARTLSIFLSVNLILFPTMPKNNFF